MKKYIRYICLALALMCAFFAVACNDDTEGESGVGGADDKGVKVYVKYNGVTVKMGEKADDVIKALGEPQKKTEIGDCGGLGALVKYSYASLEIYVVESKDNGNVIDQITLRDDIVTTPEGVAIGMSVSDAKAALGEPDNATDKALEYKNGKYVLKIGFDGDTVNEINYITQ